MESENSQYFSSRVFNDFLVLEWKNQDKTRHPAQTDGANCRTLREIALHWASERWVGKLQLLFCKQNSFHGFPSLILRCDFIRKIIIRSFLTYSTSSTSSACLPEGPMTDSGRNSDAIHHKTWNIISSAATKPQHFTISSGMDREWFIEHIHFDLGECINTNKTFTPISLNRFSNVLPNPNLEKNAC